MNSYNKSFKTNDAIKSTFEEKVLPSSTWSIRTDNEWTTNGQRMDTSGLFGYFFFDRR